MQCLWLLLLCMTSFSATYTAEKGSAQLLRAEYASLQDKLGNNQFKRPLYLDSRESDGQVMGDIYARIDYPFAKVDGALNDPELGPANWCDVLLLHLNTKGCVATDSKTGAVLTVYIGSKDEQALDDAYPVKFAYKVAAAGKDYFRIELSAESGPLSTSDYRIMLEAVDIGDGRTFLHLTYSYSYGLAGSLAMKTYLATAGRDKVGFTITGRDAQGKPQYIDGIRGVVERNTMRYYLAIDAYLSAIDSPTAQQLEKRLQHWFAATQQYARQLKEVEREAYLSMKRKEYRRQQDSR